MFETMMTIRGNVVDSPKLRSTKSGHVVANFRVASTQRRFDREQGAWVDGDTLFVAVSAWRTLGENAAKSLQKGQPVVVYGRYYQRDYTKDETIKTAYELDALAVGHDLSRGVTRFERAARPLTPQLEVDETGGPRDVTHEYLGVIDEDAIDDGADGGAGIAGEVDLDTGEVRELAPA